MNRWSALAVLLAVAGALALRVPKLSNRPFHNDEAVNAIKATELWQHGRYAYDPDEYHGPALHYATLPSLWLSGADADHLDEATFRYAPVAFGVGLILLLLLFSEGLGRHALAWAALFIAVSPAMVFYSRYFIHEMSLVFYTTLTLGAGWRYAQTRRAAWAIIAGAGVGLMFATKETFVITLGAIGSAGILTAWWSLPEEKRIHNLLSLCNWRHATFALLAASFIWLLFFSSFFTNWAGPADSFLTYLPWLKRAGGHSPHIHPWSFYLERLAWFHPKRSPVWSEGLVLALAFIGIGVSLLGKKSALHRFLTLYTIILTAAYSVISYKTPWCLLSFYCGAILLAGVGAAWLVEFFRATSVRAIVIVAILGLSAQLTVQAWRASFVFPARGNPYVYAQTVPDLLNLVKKVEGIAAIAPAGHATVVKVIAPNGDYWPLPWYLRRFEHIGWYDKLPGDPFAPIVVVSSKLDARLDEKSDKKWIMAGLSEMRVGVFLELYVELELWKKYVSTLPREED